MKTLAFILFLLFTRPVNAETIIIPVQDLIFELPNFTNAPQFSIRSAINGTNPIGDIRKLPRKERKEIERKLINLLWGEYPEAESIRIWNSNLIIKL